MRVSFSWLNELVDLKVPLEKLLELIPLRIQGGIKEVTDKYFELDLKGYNRSDLLALRGVALEVAAITGSPITFSEKEASGTKIALERKIGASLQVSIESKDLCPFYSLVKIEGLKLTQSSDDWKQKLINSGLRSINNIADITNLIMLEYGQPLHAFDCLRVEEGKIIVRTAQKGEKLITLDNKERLLEETDLLIADGKRPLGLAGVMGGKESEVNENTTSILLEAAMFDPATLRKTVRRLSLPSEASKRFIHGLTKKRLLQALEAAISLYEKLGGRVTGYCIIDNLEEKQKSIKLHPDKARSLIGIDITDQEIESYLYKLQFNIQKDSEKNWTIKPPFYRLDINLEEDLIEEIARMYGYEKISPKPLEGQIPEKIDQSLFFKINSLREKLVTLGLTEIQTYSFFSTDVLDNLDKDKTKLVKIKNPISSQTEYLRDDLWPNLLEAVIKNLKHGFDDIAIFEIGKIYQEKKDSLPQEEFRLSLALSNSSDNLIQELISIFKNYSSEYDIEQTYDINNYLYHPRRQALIQKKGKIVGKIFEVHQRIVDKFSSNKRVAILELVIYI